MVSMAHCQYASLAYCQAGSAIHHKTPRGHTAVLMMVLHIYFVTAVLMIKQCHSDAVSTSIEDGQEVWLGAKHVESIRPARTLALTVWERHAQGFKIADAVAMPMHCIMMM